MDRDPAVAADRASSRRSCALPFGIAIGWLLARKNFWGKSLLDGLVHLPLVLPPVVTGYLLLLAFGRRGPIGAFLDRVFRHRVLVPLDRRGARLRRHGLSAAGARDPAVDRSDRPRLEDAAATLGANRCWVFATVTLPLALPGIIAGMVLCFAKALGEFGATITFVSNIPGRNADHLGRDLHANPGARRRRRGGAAGDRRHRDRRCWR